MRFWHKDLVSVLPNNLLAVLWKNCCGFVKGLYETKNGKMYHDSAIKASKYNIGHLLLYANMVADEMENRGYKINIKNFDKYYMRLNLKEEVVPFYENLFEGWHNDRYLTQCYYILQEKFDNGVINENEWKLIESKYKKMIKKK